MPNIVVISEKYLIHELHRGNAKAFENLYIRYHLRLYNFCHKILRDTQEAEDLVQEVFVSIWENRKNLDEEKSFSGFIFRIAKNKMLNKIKHNLSRKVYTKYQQQASQNQGDLRNDLEFHEMKSVFQKTIHNLPEKTKEIFLLSREKGLTYKEIAHRLNISENIVDHEIRKSLQYIREEMEKLHFV